MKIKHVAFFLYPVTDLQRARRFYEQTLGLTLETDFNGHWLEYDINGATLAISDMLPDKSPVKTGGLALEVDDLEAGVEQLQQKGVTIVAEPAAYPACKLALIADPDGNVIGLHQHTQPQ
jgi:predicted enzyme related to lactoylglutathione lyase